MIYIYYFLLGSGNKQIYLIEEFSGSQSMSPGHCWFSRLSFNFCLTNGILAQKSEFLEEPITIMLLSSGTLFSSISLINLFHKWQDLKTKLFLEISKATIGGCNKKPGSLWLRLNKEYKEIGVRVFKILNVLMKVWYT